MLYGYSFISYIKADDVEKDVETRSDTFESGRWLPKEKVKEVIGLMRDELDGKIIEKLVGLRGKTYSYLKDNNDEDK